MDRGKKVTLLQENYKLIKTGKERWQDKRIAYLMAQIYTSSNKKYSDQRYRQLNDELKQELGTFHSLSKPTSCFLLAMMLSQGAHSRSLLTLLNDYRRLREAGFSLSAYSYFAAYLVHFSEAAKKESLVKKAYGILKATKKKHFFLTGAEDGVTAISLGQAKQLDHKNAEEIADIVEQYYRAFNEISFYRSNELQIAAATAAQLTGEFSEALVLHIPIVVDRLNDLGIRLKGTFYSSVITLAFLDLQESLNFADLAAYLELVLKETDLRFYKETRQVLALNLFLNENSSDDLKLPLLMLLIKLAEEQALIVASAGS
jgi:hypothetical protein